MLIGLLSDTHIPEAARVLPAQIKEAFRGVDLILHAGDIYVVSVLDELERLAPVLAASGDDDYLEVDRDSRVKVRHTLTVGGLTLLLTHIRPYLRPVDSMQHSYPARPPYEKPPDIIVSGHAHRARVENYGDILVVNPGSPTFPDYQSKLGTVALLTVRSGKAEVCIVQLQERPT